jgi:glucose/arabinose dehydrogenase
MTYNGSSLSGYTTIVTGIAKNRYHNGGRLAFGPDGYGYRNPQGIAWGWPTCEGTCSVSGMEEPEAPVVGGCGIAQWHSHRPGRGLHGSAARRAAMADSDPERREHRHAERVLRRNLRRLRTVTKVPGVDQF